MTNKGRDIERKREKKKSRVQKQGNVKSGKLNKIFRAKNAKENDRRGNERKKA